jgi:uncharacterized membrane protein YfcA
MTEIVLFTVGIFVGAMNSIAGGGMLLGFPVLLAFGIPPIVANATSSIIVLPGQISSAYGYRKYLKQIPHRYFLLIVPCIIGGAVGATWLRNTAPEHFERLLPWLILFAVILFAFQPYLHLHLHRHMHGPKKHRKRVRPLVLIGLAMLPLSVYGGFFGAGFGFIMLAFLGFTKLHEAHKINALKNVMAIGVIIASFTCLFSAHLIDWRHGLFMSAGNFVGGYAGALSAQRVSSHGMRIAVICIGLCTVSYMMFRSFQL